jgi:cytoskeletal protein RodZ
MPSANQSRVQNEQEPKKRNKTVLLIFFLLVILIILIIIIFSMSKKDNENTTNADTTPTTEEEYSNDEDDNRTETETDVAASDEVPSCAPEFTGGQVDSHTSTQTTWSYYFTDASSESVQAYVSELRTEGWTTIKEQTIASTTFIDMQSDTCSFSLRYHAPDNGVTLEVKEK